MKYLDQIKLKFIKNSSIEKSRTDGYYIFLRSYLQSPFRDFESYLRILTGKNEDDIQLIIKQNKSKFKTYRISPGGYTFENLAVVLSRGFGSEFELRGRMRPDNKYDMSDSVLIDDVSLFTKLTLKPDITALKFNDKSFFNTILGFSPH